MSLPIANLCGQTYDAATIMLDHKKKVSKETKEEQPKALERSTELVCEKGNNITAWKVFKYGVISGLYFRTEYRDLRKIPTRNNSVFVQF